MKKNLIKETEGEQIVLLMIPEKRYAGTMIDVARQLADHFERPCYVSLNKSYDTLVSSLQAKKAEAYKFFFIDCCGTMGPIFEPVTMKNCEYIAGPRALTQMSTSISKNIEAQKSDVLLFDSLSTLLIYEVEISAIRFVHELIGIVRRICPKAFFTILEGDGQSNLARNLEMFVDRTIHVGK